MVWASNEVREKKTVRLVMKINMVREKWKSKTNKKNSLIQLRMI